MGKIVQARRRLASTFLGCALAAFAAGCVQIQAESGERDVSLEWNALTIR